MVIQNPYWDHHTLVHRLSATIELPESFPNDILFAKTKDLAGNIPINNIGKADIYIYIYIIDIIGIALDKDNSVNQVNTAISLNIHGINQTTRQS